MVRLAGLYSEVRGPHSYWLRRARDAAAAGTPQTVIPGSSAACLNMLHYEDAAAAVLAAVKATGKALRLSLSITNFLILTFLVKIQTCRFRWRGIFSLRRRTSIQRRDMQVRARIWLVR